MNREVVLWTGMLLLNSALSFASGDATAPKANPQVGSDRAVTAFDPEQGFQLSEKATQALNVKFMSLEGTGPWKIPRAGLVRIKHSTAVYRRFENWITLVVVKVVQDSGSIILIRSDDLEPKDLIAVSGTDFLRMTEVDLNTDTVDGCAH